MRAAIFTLNPALERSPWWPVLLATRGLDAVLVCRQVPSRALRDTMRRLRRNIAKHGWIYVPYRVGVGVLDLLRRPFAEAAASPGVPLPTGVACEALETTDLHAPDVLARIQAWRPDLGISLGAPVLRPSVFRIPRLGTVNLHLGKVPDFRGAPPGFWELFRGATEVGATVHWINEGVDTGPVITQALAPLYVTDTLERVEARATELGLGVFAEALRRIVTGDGAGTPQESGGRTFRFPTVAQRARLAWRLALRRLAGACGDVRSIAKGAALLAALAILRPLRDLGRTLTGTHPVRVFTFHRVTDLCRDGMTVPPAVFRRQLAYVKRHHDVISLERALELLRHGARLRRPVAVLTFDDGYRSVVTRAWPELAALGLVGCCFVCTDLIETSARLPHDAASPVRDRLDLMTWSDLARLRRAGWTVGGHTATHARLSRCDGATLASELARPLDALGARLGLGAVAMAYPFGGRDDVPAGFADLAQRAGYVACFANFGGENPRGTSLHDLRRIDVGGDHSTLAWRAYVHGLDLPGWRGWWERSFLPGQVRSA